jgi:hypothetical protein
MCCWGHLIGGKTAAQLGIEYPSWYGDSGDLGFGICDIAYPVLFKF